jgi:hypothetical protein
MNLPVERWVLQHNSRAEWLAATGTPVTQLHRAVRFRTQGGALRFCMRHFPDFLSNWRAVELPSDLETPRPAA